jgi:hypothetical protein
MNRTDIAMLLFLHAQFLLYAQRSFNAPQANIAM